MMFSKPHFHLPGKDRRKIQIDHHDRRRNRYRPGARVHAGYSGQEAKGEKFGDVVLYSGGQFNADASQDEMENAHADGVLTALPSYAISREGEKLYIQKHLDRDAEAIRRMTEGGKGLVYICGAKEAGNQIIEKLKTISPALQEHQIHTDLY